MAKRRISKKEKKTLMIVTAILVVILVTAIVVLYVTGNLNSIIDGLLNFSPDTSDNGDSGNDGNSGNSGGGDTIDRGDSYGEIDGDSIKIHFVFVGQGDGIVIELPNDEYMLIDAGSGTSASSANKNRYYTYLDEVIDGEVIDYLVVTHPDSDHVNMMTKVVEDYQIENFYYNDFYDDGSNTYRTFMDTAIAESGATCNIIDTDESSTFTLTVGECQMTFFSPGNDGFGSGSVKKNAMSIMILLTYGERKMLFTGDAPSEEEEWFMLYTENYDMDVDFLKVGHHGSQYSSTAEFLEYVSAEYAIISVDEDSNSYGHPTQDALDRLEDSNAKVYRTDVDGTIILTIDDDGDYAFSFVK